MNESYKMINHLSYSQLNIYQQCPFKYYLQYIKKNRTSEPMAFKTGREFHTGMETLYKTRSFVKAKEVFRGNMIGAGEREDIIDNLTLEMHQYSTSIMPKYIDDVVGTEVDFEIRLPGVAVPIVGKIDNLLISGFIDYKTTSSFDDSTLYNPKQLATYALYFYGKYKRMPTICDIHYFNKLKNDFGVISENLTLDSLNMIACEYIQMWKDIVNERWTVNMAAWKESDDNYDLACEFSESLFFNN